MEEIKTADIPIVCTLSDEDFRRREREVIGKLMPRVTSVESIAEGSIYSFPKVTPDRIDIIGGFMPLVGACVIMYWPRA